MTFETLFYRTSTDRGFGRDIARDLPTMYHRNVRGSGRETLSGSWMFLFLVGNSPFCPFTSLLLGGVRGKKEAGGERRVPPSLFNILIDRTSSVPNNSITPLSKTPDLLKRRGPLHTHGPFFVTLSRSPSRRLEPPSVTRPGVLELSRACRVHCRPNSFRPPDTFRVSVVPVSILSLCPLAWGVECKNWWDP